MEPLLTVRLDRWGRNLIRKAERSRARDEGRVPRQLDDLDFLLGVSDDTRQGALRFRAPGSDEFLGEPSRVPRLVALPELLHASDELASDDDPSGAVKRLLDTGTTGLGGARPKASVRLDDGGLAIAKFLTPATPGTSWLGRPLLSTWLGDGGRSHTPAPAHPGGIEASLSCGDSTEPVMAAVSAISVP